MSDEIAYCKIHPAIGIARVGNSPAAFFVGPEIPGAARTPLGGYKDAGDPVAGIAPRVKRQAARFRIFAYSAAGAALGELTLAEADITWSAHLVNSKAEGDTFAGRTGEELPIGERRERQYWRNTDIDDRASLIIDPGARTLAGPAQSARFDGGTFRGKEVLLGEVRTDDDGRLLVLGGHGVSAATTASAKITTYANNDRWHDDVSDGPIRAQVTLKSGRTLDVSPAWVIVAPPDFAPAVQGVTSLYDVALNVALRHGLSPLPGDVSARPSFTRDIAPIFERLRDLAWVQTGGRGAAGALDAYKDMPSLQDASDAARTALFGRFRDPTLPENSPQAISQATADFLPALSGDDGDASPGRPGRWLRITATQYETLRRWRDGDFERDWGQAPAPPAEITPQGLDRAALEAGSGGAFYPGIEGGWLLRNPQAYIEPFRLNADLFRPGDLTRRMALPWQADFFECKANWWPAQRPDEVLTLDAYRQIREIEEALAQAAPGSPEHAHLEETRDRLLADRSAWARGLPDEAPDGDRAMVERWAQHGFVVGHDQDGEPFVLPDGSSALVETERGRYEGLGWPEYFHILTNIEQHPDFLPKAKELARNFFAGADYSDEMYRPFPYSPEAFDQRLAAIYDNYVAAMNNPSRMDSGIIQWPVVVRKDGDREITKTISFNVGRFSDRAVKERLRQRAPFNLVDGAWLQRIQSAGPADTVRTHLFSVWADEAGNGRTEQNHCNVYDALLRSLNIYMPPITSRSFIEQPLLPAAFIQPVFQFVVGLFPDEFFPELLGMTLYLEWEASPTLTPTVRHYRGRGIDPHFYSLHVAIDNITAGHGFLAKEAIKLYLQRAEDEAGSDGVQEAWRRIWSGYVTWATAGDLGRDLTELCMIIDHKQIDLAYPAMLWPEHVLDATGLIDRLALAAREDAARDPVSDHLVGRFVPSAQARLRATTPGGAPSQDLVGLVVDELNRLIQGDASFYEEARFKDVKLGKDTKALLVTKPRGEALVTLNRLLLRDAYPGQIADLPVLPPQPFPDYRAHYRQKFVDLVRRKAPAARPLHTRVTIKVGNDDLNLAQLFDVPGQLVDVLAQSDLIDVRHPRSSRFFDLLSFSGPMYKIFTEEEVDVILDWIESLRPDLPPAPVPTPGPTPAQWAERMLGFITDNATVAAGIARHGDYNVDGQSLLERFADPRGLMAALAGSPSWVVPGDSAASRLYREFNEGRMRIVNQQDLVRGWIDSGALVPPQDAAPSALALSAVAMKRHVSSFSSGDQTEIEPTSALGVAPITAGGDAFAQRRKLIGMGSVH